MNYESEGGVVPMLCPGCCTLAGIPDWAERDGADLKIVIGCHRCGFTFPVLPGEFKSLTLEAMHNHRCAGPERGDWDAVGRAILERLAEPDRLVAFLDAAFGQPADAVGTALALPAAPQPDGLASPGPQPRRVVRRQP